VLQEKSLATQLKDLKEYLMNKIETRFHELQKEVQKAVQVKN
jgi:type III secretory pathway component EscV